MERKSWPASATLALLLGGAGCTQPAVRPEGAEVTQSAHTALARTHSAPSPSPPLRPDGPLASAIDPVFAPPELEGPQPLEACIRRALAENRMVQAARLNVLALRHRIPQVTALDDPVVSNTIYPGSSNGLQTASGFMPWNLLVAQQFPWFGTLALRGLAAEQDVQVALAELAAAQLDTVEAVKRSYYDLHFNERSERILSENRELVEYFLEIARSRYETGQTSQQDVLMAEVMLTDLDRELVTTRQGIAIARAALAQQLHLSPEAELATLPEAPIDDVPGQIDRLYQLAVAARPELRGRLAAVARDETAVELARKRSYPNVTLGVNYGLLSTDGALSGVATGNDNIGMFVGFNLPVYRGKLDAAVAEAKARAAADAKLYEAERDSTYRQVRELLAQAIAQRETLDLYLDSILPRARQALDVASADYQTGSIDFLTLITAWREVLQIELQVAQFESLLGQTLASLERAVGMRLNDHPPILGDSTTPLPTDEVPAPPALPGSPDPDERIVPSPVGTGRADPPEAG
ncbi:TolC family protein [Tautonia sociabilis]|uniref:TolC family protein n=1 Tax=Tautonia sociabilis TaxID=2080755 RepID=A0A432MJ91_9BACT|nr:TolC family protein [Tautonia sociabilis]RUL87265.1 TolC family protein [Tautonia sociabilis]